MNDQTLSEDLRLLVNKRIFFGHQSVGVDIMQGIRELCQEADSARLNVVALADTVTPSGKAFFAEGYVGKNSEPNSKCDAFDNVVANLVKDSLDIALMKFCYVDIKAHTNIEEMFNYYVNTMEGLKERFPGVTFVHVTVPVTERSAAWRRLAKWVIGKEDVWDVASVKRTEFNDLVLQRYKEETIFDLAAIESTFPDGTRKSFEYGGKVAYSLISDYTRDGGHLNALGRRVVARQLIRTLAGIVRKSVE
ncbi:MAG TPA: hypothetical protein VFG32_06095 [Bacteroidota bacterium]|nr:hypothetical protein [Bacteroidota bacterium]